MQLGQLGVLLEERLMLPGQAIESGFQLGDSKRLAAGDDLETRYVDLQLKRRSAVRYQDFTSEPS